MPRVEAPPSPAGLLLLSAQLARRQSIAVMAGAPSTRSPLPLHALPPEFQARADRRPVAVDETEKTCATTTMLRLDSSSFQRTKVVAMTDDRDRKFCPAAPEEIDRLVGT